MKRILALIMIFLICFSLCACTNKEAEQAAKERAARIKNVEDLIEYMSDAEWELKELYLTETAEIHHNEWSAAYVKALDAYNALSADEQTGVWNADDLKDDYHIKWYNEILIEQEIALYCKDIAVEALKEKLINKSSYEEYGWILDRSYYFEDDHTFWVELKIEYSATNRMGGRIDDTEYVSYHGAYIDGKITISKL